MESRKLKILVADDEPGIARAMAMALDSRGYTSKAVFSGEDAVAAAAEFAPDVLISDVCMAGISGIEAAIQVRQILPESRIILYYGQMAPSDLLEKALAHGLQVFARHIPPQTLFAMLEESDQA